jgi:hypothetical protein
MRGRDDVKAEREGKQLDEMEENPEEKDEKTRSIKRSESSPGRVDESYVGCCRTDDWK